MRIFIVGLRRSGTTAFWRVFRQDARLCCLDEPFNPNVVELPAEHLKKTRAELIEIFERDPKAFWDACAPIARFSELVRGFSDRQRRYLRFLLDASEHTVMDLTRCHFKLEALAREEPDAVLVHLYRRASAFVTSHLVPQPNDRWRALLRLQFLQDAYSHAVFWSRRRGYNNWGMEEIIADSPDSQFGRRLAEAGMDPAAVYRLPAVGRLLAFWKLHFDTVEGEGPRHFPNRFVSVSFEDFCRDPAAALAPVYAALGEPLPEFDLSSIHPANPPHAEDDPRWRKLATQAGFRDGDCDRLL